MGMNLIQTIEAEEIVKADKTIPNFRAGDTVRIGVKVSQAKRPRNALKKRLRRSQKQKKQRRLLKPLLLKLLPLLLLKKHRLKKLPKQPKLKLWHVWTDPSPWPPSLARTGYGARFGSSYLVKARMHSAPFPFLRLEPANSP